jgi:hypothetical protein
MTASAETIPGRVPAPALRQRRCRLPAGLAAVAVARDQVRAAIADWVLPVSADIAVLATWDLVTSMLTEGPGGADGLAARDDSITEGPGGAYGTEGPAGPDFSDHLIPAAPRLVGAAPPGTVSLGTVSLGISGARGRLRVDAYDGHRYRWGTPGLAIVAGLADDWGRYRTPGGRAAYFTLRFTIPFYAQIAAGVTDTSAD